MGDIGINTSLDPRGLVRRQPATSPTVPFGGTCTLAAVMWAEP